MGKAFHTSRSQKSRGVLVAAVVPLIATEIAQAQSPRRSELSAFAIEAAGATAGSALGFGAVLALRPECSTDGDLVTCVLGPAAAALGASTVLSATGAVVVGRAYRTEPSVGGAILGSLVGVVAAVGVEHGLREELGIRINRWGSGIAIALTQGLVTAVGSRAVAALRR